MPAFRPKADTAVKLFGQGGEALERRHVFRAACACAVSLGILFAFNADAQRISEIRVGYLSGNPQADTQEALIRFRAKLRERGWLEGKNLTIDARYADGKYDQLPALAAQLVGLPVDIIFAYGTPGSVAAKRSTKTIPIVFAGVADPIAVGLVQELRHPGGTITGVTSNNPELAQKRVSLLKDIIPSAARIAVLSNPNFQPADAMLADTRKAARQLGLDVQVFEARTPAELSTAFERMHAANILAMIVLVDPMFIAQHKLIARLALDRRIAAVYHLRQFVDAGGLASYGVDYDEAFEQAALLVDKVAKGSQPGDIAVEQPWRFPLVINVRTAQAIGLTIPSNVLIRADQIIN
jgi:putative tryptophan/tyrosine transport system substrate-binding protein